MEKNASSYCVNTDGGRVPCVSWDSAVENESQTRVQTDPSPGLESSRPQMRTIED